MKTKIDYSVAALIIIFGLTLLLPAVLVDSFSQHTFGKIYIALMGLLIFLGLLKIEQIELKENVLIKTNFIFKRTIDLKKIKKFKIKETNLNDYPQYNISSILKMFKHGARYSNCRFLTIYTNGSWRLNIDERTMPVSDFNKIIREIKKRKKHLT